MPASNEIELIAPWFAREEYLNRLERAQEKLQAQKLAALLAFEPESVTYLTGFFTRGYDSFQFAVIPAQGEPLIVCRDTECYYLDKTSVFERRYFWSDGDDKIEAAADGILFVVAQTDVVGIELASWQLNASRFVKLQAALPAVRFVDCSQLVSRQRIIKSPAEIAYQRRAGKAAEAGMAAGINAAQPGASEREVAGAICQAMILAGSERPGPGVLSSGERAFHLHGGYSDRVIQAGDHVQIETTPSVRYYHARFMRPIKAGFATQQERDTVEKLIEIQDRALQEVAPGMPAAVPDAIYRQGVLKAGLAKQYSNKTFYSVGLMFEPTSGEPLEATANADWHFEPGMTLHSYLLAQGFGVSETIAITETGFERLTNFPRQLFVSS